MPQVVSFLPENSPPLIIEENTGLAVNQIDATEVYSEWKDWLLADASRLKYPKAFQPEGGVPITALETLGVTRFLVNGWRIRPAEYSHKLVIDGNLFTIEEGESIFVATVGTFNVHTETKVSTLVLQIEGLPQKTTSVYRGPIDLRVRS